MIIDFDKFNRYEKPILTLAFMNRKEIGQLGSYIHLKCNLVFNGLSEITFEYPQKCEDGQPSNCFSEIKENRLICTDGIGRYVITKVTKNNDGIKNILSITATSLEYELGFRKLTLFSGTYKFYDLLKPEDSLLGKIALSLGNWTVEYVSSELCTKYRTFEISDETVYSFLTNTVAPSYACIFQFDTYKQTISAYSINDTIRPTDIYVSYVNLIKNESIETETEGIYTAMSCYGGNDLSIASVNPLGGATIYEFEHCYSDMSEELVATLKNWESLFETNKTEYQNKLLLIKSENANLIKLNSELVELNSDYKAKKEVQAVMIQGSQTHVTDYKILIANMNDLETRTKTKEKEIADKQNIVNNIKKQLLAINQLLSFKNKDIFSDLLYNELQYFVRETTYQDDTFIQTSTMSLVEIQDMAQNLYDQSVILLNKMSQPRYNITVDSVNFLFLPEFAPIVNYLDTGKSEKVKQLLGCTFNLEVEEDEFIQPVLLSLSLNYDDPKDFSMTFANKYKLSGGMWTFTNLMSEVGRISHSTNFTYSSVKDFNSYKGDLIDFMNSSLDATKNELVNNSKNIEMQLDTTGLIGKKIDINTGNYLGEQMWLTNNVLAFTKDKFSTVETALGKILLPNGTYDYGLNANVLIGKQVFSASHTISNESNTIIMDQSGFSMTTNNNAGRITLFPSDGIKIQTNSGSGWKDKFYVDALGNAMFEGTLKAYEGTIGGFQIGQDYIKSTNGVINIKSDGTGKMGLLTWTTNRADFDGNIYADNLDDYGITSRKIDDEAVDNRTIEDRAVTPRKLDRIYATEAQFDRLSALVANFGEVYATKASVNYLAANMITANQIRNVKFFKGCNINCDEIHAGYGDFTEGNMAIGYIGNLFVDGNPVEWITITDAEGETYRVLGR